MTSEAQNGDMNPKKRKAGEDGSDSEEDTNGGGWQVAQHSKNKPKLTLDDVAKRLKVVEEKQGEHERRLDYLEAGYKKFNLRFKGIPVRKIPAEDKSYFMEELAKIAKLILLPDDFINRVFTVVQGKVSEAYRIPKFNDVVVIFKDTEDVKLILQYKSNLSKLTDQDKAKSISINAEKTKKRMSEEREARIKLGEMKKLDEYKGKKLHCIGTNITVDGDKRHFTKWTITLD